MPAPKRIIRGVKDIRTRSGTPDQVIVPYKAYMAITALEMEKFRRETERDNLIAPLEQRQCPPADGRIGKSGPACSVWARRRAEGPAGGRSNPPGQ